MLHVRCDVLLQGCVDVSHWLYTDHLPLQVPLVSVELSKHPLVQRGAYTATMLLLGPVWVLHARHTCRMHSNAPKVMQR